MDGEHVVRAPKTPRGIRNIFLEDLRIALGRDCNRRHRLLTYSSVSSFHQFSSIHCHQYPVSTSNYTAQTYRTGIAIMFRRVLATASPQAGRNLLNTCRPSTSAPFITASRQVIGSRTARRSYHEKVLDHYNNPRNVGSFKKGDSDIGTGLVGAPACGDVMKIQIKVDPNNDTITDVKFKTFGCGSAIASSSYLTELVKGMTLEQAGRIKNTEIAKELCLPPVKCKPIFGKPYISSSTRTDLD